MNRLGWRQEISLPSSLSENRFAVFRVPPLASEPAATGNATLLGGEITLERKISLTELADRVGITMANLSILKNNKARAVRFSTLDALCRELDCQPGDILSYRTGEEEESAD